MKGVVYPERNDKITLPSNIEHENVDVFARYCRSTILHKDAIEYERDSMLIMKSSIDICSLNKL